jgi:hypothetical protein
MGFAAFNRSASGKGAHGPDRSRLANCCQRRTNRGEWQSAAAAAPAAPDGEQRISMLIEQVQPADRLIMPAWIFTTPVAWCTCIWHADWPSASSASQSWRPVPRYSRTSTAASAAISTAAS